VVSVVRLAARSGSRPAVVASALMALEAWGHGRIEKGRNPSIQWSQT
jgi:hypothetical protein